MAKQRFTITLDAETVIKARSYLPSGSGLSALLSELLNEWNDLQDELAQFRVKIKKEINEKEFQKLSELNKKGSICNTK